MLSSIKEREGKGWSCLAYERAHQLPASRREKRLPLEGGDGREAFLLIFNLKRRGHAAADPERSEASCRISRTQQTKGKYPAILAEGKKGARGLDGLKIFVALQNGTGTQGKDPIVRVGRASRPSISQLGRHVLSLEQKRKKGEERRS